jgi:Holliday junction resolvase
VNTTAKGTRWARAVEVFLNGAGFGTVRRAWRDAGDDMVAVRGDVVLSVEAKDHKAITLAAFVDQAERQAGDGQVPVVVIKRPRRPSVDDAYVVMSGRAFRRLHEK